MNKYAYLLFLFLLIHCDEPEPDDRDNWVGLWYGTTRYEGWGAPEVKKDQIIEFLKQKGHKELLCTGNLNFSLILQSNASGNFHYQDPGHPKGDYWVTCNINGDSLFVEYQRWPYTINGRFGRK